MKQQEYKMCIEVKFLFSKNIRYIKCKIQLGLNLETLHMLFLTSFFICSGCIIPKIECDIKKVQHEHHENGANKHWYSTK